MLTLAASPPAAERIGADLLLRQAPVLLPAHRPDADAGDFAGLAAPHPAAGVAGVLRQVLLLAATFIGVEIKGARRWISVPGLSSLQPSEFVKKPSLAVISAWLLAQGSPQRAPGYILSTLLVAGVLALLVMQPDLGMSVWWSPGGGAQLFVVGLPMWVAAWRGRRRSRPGRRLLHLPPRAQPVRPLPRSSSGDNYQVNTSLEAFMNGGLFGRGPGEGTVKHAARRPYRFRLGGPARSSACCLMILALFAFVTMRGCRAPRRRPACSCSWPPPGLLVQFGLQAAINMASNLQLDPGQGHDPAVHLLWRLLGAAMAICLGMMLSLTREHAGLREAVWPQAAPWSWRAAAPAGTCSRPRRWRASSRRAACRSRWSPSARPAKRRRCRRRPIHYIHSASPAGARWAALAAW